MCGRHNSKTYFQPFLEAILSIGPAILIASLLLAMTLYSLTAFANPLTPLDMGREFSKAEPPCPYLMGLLDVSASDEQYREVYDFWDRMVAKKVIGGILKNSRPYSRGEVATALVDLDKKVSSGNITLSRIDQKRLAYLMRIFAFGSDETATVDLPDGQYHDDEYLLITQGESYRFGLSMEAGETIVNRKQSNTTRSEVASKSEANGRSGSSQQTGYVTLLRPTVTGQVKDNFAFYSDLKFYYLSGATFPDIPKTEAKVGQAGLDATTAALAISYAKFKLPWFELLLGKENLSWGPGRHGALLISDNSLPMNMVKLTAWYKQVKFQAFTSILGSGTCLPPCSGRQVGKKYMSGHRLEFNLWDKVSLGLCENVVYANRFETIYTNPFQIYAVTEIPSKIVEGESVSSPDNVLVSGDLDIFPLKNLEFYGELLLDDFYPNYGLRSPFNWGSKWGILLGFYYVNPFSIPDTDLRVEYTFINQYTYTHEPMDTTYTHYDAVIGHHIGADADDLFFDVRHWFTDKLRIAIGYELERHGEGEVNKPHPKDAPRDDEWEFLSGVTESTNSLSLGVFYAVVGRYFANVKYTVSWVKNVSNKLNENNTRHQFILNGSYRF
ncbi:capsule assembly Wzi family protein [Candidatus Poribacteria bacterium]|nr:capsule assembly Wzi family protein [Candidatus Poribacteria bacterium]